MVLVVIVKYYVPLYNYNIHVQCILDPLNKEKNYEFFPPLKITFGKKGNASGFITFGNKKCLVHFVFKHHQKCMDMHFPLL